MTADSPRGTVPRPYVAASLATVLLAALASAVGVFVPGFYRDAAVLVPQARGQDLLTLVVALPVLAGSLYLALGGSRRAYVVWLGATGYLLYTYASYAFMTAFNRLYLVYVVLFTLSLFVLVGGTARLDAVALKRAVGDHPVRAYVAFQLLVAFLVGAMWLSEVVPATLSGDVPPSAAEAGLPVSAIHSLDLGVVVPAFALSAYWLWKRRAWGYVFTGVLLVKGTTLGLAVLAMIVLMVRDGFAVTAPQIATFVLLSALGVVLVVRYVRSIDPGTGSSPVDGRGLRSEDLR